jgi:hypothetical protein
MDNQKVEKTKIRIKVTRITLSEWETPEKLFKCIKGEVLHALLKPLNIKNGENVGNKRRSLIMFDHLLYALGEPQITSTLALQTERFETLQKIYYGALSSDKFFGQKDTTRIGIGCDFYKYMRSAGEYCDIRIPKYVPNSNRLDYTFHSLFEKQKFDQKALLDLQPYILVDKHGIEYEVDLKDMRIKLGSDYANTFHKLIAEHSKTKAKNTALRDFCNCFSRYIGTKQFIDSKSLMDESFMNKFIIDFMKFHFMRYVNMKNGPQVGSLPSLQKLWSRYINYFELVFEYGLMARPKFGLPKGNTGLCNTTEVKHQKKIESAKDENKYITNKLITPIPLHLTDDQATKLVFEQLENDLERVKSFLEEELIGLFNFYEKGEELARKVTSIRYNYTKKSFSENNELCLANAISYFKVCHDGYCDTKNEQNLVFHHRTASAFTKTEINNHLGLPTRSEAQVFMAYLTILNPSITEAALADANLLDRKGNRINAIETNKSVMISVLKDRKKNSKWMEISYDDEGAEILEKWIEVTNPIRNYMRKNGISGWRKLIVYLSTPLGSPATFKRSSNMYSTFRGYLIGHRYRLGDLADQVTFSKLRATKGIVIFMKKKNLSEMAQALGNTNITSMRDYMPDALWEYFSNRWIRIFQNLLIIEATKDTPYLLDSTDFSSMAELDGFMRNFTFNRSNEKCNDIKNKDAELVVSASHEVFSILKSLSSAVKNAVNDNKVVSGLALYWHEFSTTLGSHIEDKNYKDYSIKNIWNNADINPEKFIGVVCNA